MYWLVRDTSYSNTAIRRTLPCEHTSSSNCESKMTATTDLSSKDKVYVSHAPPPFHSVITLISLSAFFVAFLPTWEAVDKVATMDAFTNRVFPDLVSLRLLIYIRVSFCILVFSITVLSMFPGNG